MALKDEIGVIAWFSLMTTNTEKSNDYYTKLMGWELSDFAVGDDTVKIYSAAGAPFGNPVPLDGNDIPTHWIAYFSVEDVDASCAKASELGGAVCVEPFDLPTVGRTAVVTDPAGAAFHLFTPENKEQPVNVVSGKPGQVCWLEMMVDDPEAAKAFYGGLLGWDVEDSEMEGITYLIGKVGEAMVAGIMKRPDDVPPTPPAWLPYFMVESLATSSAKAQELGAQKLMGPMQISMGSFSLFQDPAGGVAYLFEGADESAQG
jgi:uncharacterized protein